MVGPPQVVATTIQRCPQSSQAQIVSTRYAGNPTLLGPIFRIGGWQLHQGDGV